MTPRIREEEIKALARLSTMVNSTLDLRQVLDNAMSFVEELMDAEASAIFEVDQEQNNLCFRVARGEAGDKVREVRLAIGEGIAGCVARDDKPILVADARQDGRFTPRIDEHTGFRTRSVVAVPIKNKGRLIGVLEVLNKRGGPFDEDDANLLTVVSNQIGIAIENARLYQRLQEKFSLTADELRKTQNRLIQTERLAALGRLSQGVAHEVRNPVMSIGGFAMRLKQRLAPDDPSYRYVDIILKEAARLEKMVRDVEHYAKMPEPEFREVKLGNLIEKAVSAWDEHSSRPDIQVHLNIPDVEVTFPGDEPLLLLMLKNLLRNARQAMTDGGQLTVSAHASGRQVIIKVADTGIGIPEKSLPHIYDPFFTSKTQGSGLGLTTVHRIVTEHNGEITVESTPGKGTEFEVRLPLYPDDLQLSELGAGDQEKAS